MDNLEKRIAQTWATFFKCRPADFDQERTDIILHEDQRGSRRVDLWTIGRHAFLRIDPDLEAMVRNTVQAKAQFKCFTVPDLLKSWANQQATLSYTVDICFLYPSKFQTQTLVTPFQTRQLLLEDSHHLEALKAACSNDDIESADIAIDNEVVWGCFHNAQLVSVASMYKVWGGFADVGILTHPAFRGQGVGKATVSAICTYLLAQNEVVLYRYEIRNKGSGKIARALGFRKTCQQQGIKVSL
ncbi:MAG: GNAT family N-acetyltransferase [Chloroflexota bacterium]